MPKISDLENWQQLIIIPGDRDDIDLICDLLTLSGAVAVTLKDAQDEPLYALSPDSTPLWQNNQIIALFKQAIEITAALHLLQAHADPIQFDYTIDQLDEQDWQRCWQQYCQPICFKQRLWIYPSWCTPPADDCIKICIDPGLAFGTGSHATTALCLEWLCMQDLSGKTVIDYGCGSGILAIAAIKCGAKHAYAVDCDPQALYACRANMRHNQINSAHFTIIAPQQSPDLQADLLLANILARPLITLAPQLANAVKPEGHILLSGILAEQANAVQDAYLPWFTFDAGSKQENWVCLSGVRLRTCA